MKALILMCILSTSLFAGKRLHLESWYQAKVATALEGKTEVSVENSRVDIVTKTHAIEVDFANKWQEAIGQALW